MFRSKFKWVFISVLLFVTAAGGWAEAVTPISIDYSQWEGYSLERIGLPAEDGSTIPFILVKPNKWRPVPVLFALHGMTASKEVFLTLGEYGKAGDLTLKVLKAGYALAAPDFRMHGERQEVAYPDFQSYFNAVVGNWESMYNNSYSDFKICLEYLESRQDINTNRMGLSGYSMGGQTTFKLAADYPEKFKVVVACVPPVLKDLPISGVPQASAPQITTLPFIMMSASEDTNYTMEEAVWLYRLIPSPNKKMMIYDSGHDLPLEYTDDILTWLKHYIPVRSWICRQ